jgi:hypothetical protein
VQRYASSFGPHDESASDARKLSLTQNICKVIEDISRRNETYSYALTLLERRPAYSIEEDHITQLAIAVALGPEFAKPLLAKDVNTWYNSSLIGYPLALSALYSKRPEITTLLLASLADQLQDNTPQASLII